MMSIEEYLKWVKEEAERNPNDAFSKLFLKNDADHKKNMERMSREREERKRKSEADDQKHKEHMEQMDRESETNRQKHKKKWIKWTEKAKQIVKST